MRLFLEPVFNQPLQGENHSIPRFQGRCPPPSRRQALAVLILLRWGLKSTAYKKLEHRVLESQPHRLAEARQLAEEALSIRQTLDPAAAKIWITYHILAQIANKQNDTYKTSEYRRKSQEAKAGTRYELWKHGSLIVGVVASVIGNTEVRKELESQMEIVRKEGENLVAVIHRVLDGERDEEVLYEPLNYVEADIINAILRGIEEPETLKELLE